MKKKIISLILAIVTLISVFSMTTMSAYAGLLYEYPNSNPKLDYQPKYPLRDFPAGSHFNDKHFKGVDNSDSDCTHHGKGLCDYTKLNSCECTNYASAIQCAGFAKYAYDQYSHRTEWDNVAGDKNNNVSGKPISNQSLFESYLKQIESGSYVRLLKSNGKDGHSFILISTSNAGVTMYDANYNNPEDCKVRLHTVSYDILYTAYKSGTVQEVYCHKFSKISNAKNNYYDYTQYHKKACSSSGCDGYILQPHYAQTPGTKVKCLGCGYIGNIISGIASIEDELSAISDPLL